jgi:serine/threonine protein kinase
MIVNRFDQTDLSQKVERQMEPSPEVRQRIGDYLIFGNLGSGMIGKVKLGRHSVSGQQVAIKIIKQSHFDKNPDLRVKVNREIALMRFLDHPHLLKLTDVCESPHHLYLILEYAPHGELFDFLVSMRVLPIDQGMHFFRQIIYGLDFLHAHAICHRDLKPENILMDEFNDLKIADFGFARWMRSNIAETSCGSPHYAAPEVVRGIPYDGKAADIWSCGVILFALFAGRLPFNDPSIRNLLVKVKSGQYAMPDFPPPIQSLISGMLTVDPAARLRVDQIKEHPAFRIGLEFPMYILPTPLPMPNVPDPVDPANVDPGIIALLGAIGYKDETLRADFLATGTNMAKIFYFRFMVATSLENLPWQAQDYVPHTDALMVSPQAMPFVSPSPDGFAGRAGAQPIGSPYVYSLAERPGWANFSPGQFKSDFVQPCVDIVMPLEVLMGKMQQVLVALNFQWFHPNDRELIAKGPDNSMYLMVRVRQVSMETMAMDLFFTQATQEMAGVVMDAVRVALTGD